MRSLIALLLALWFAPAWAQVPMTGAGKGTPSAIAGMVTPILSLAGPSAGPSNTAVNYTGAQSGVTGSWSASLGARSVPVGINGTISNLYARLPTAVAGGTTYDIALMVNGVADASFTCQITSTSIGCSDTTHTVAVTAGQTLEWRLTPTGTPNAQTRLQIAAKLTSSTVGEGTILSVGSGNPSQSALNYIPIGGVHTWIATEASASSLMPTTGVIDQLYVVVSGAPGTAKSYDFTLYKNGSPTSLTCQVAGNAATTCSDLNTGHAISVAATDLISIESSPTGTPSLVAARFGLRWVPTIPGEAVALSTSVGAPSTGTTYGNISGSMNGDTSDASAYNIVPSVFTLKKLYAAIDVVPGVGKSRDVNARTGNGGGQSTSLTCNIGAAVMSCNDTSSTYTTTAADLLNVQTVGNGTPAAVAYLKTGMVLYTP